MSALSASAPAVNSAYTANSWPLAAAAISVVLPSAPVLTSAPPASSTYATAALLYHAAVISAELPATFAMSVDVSAGCQQCLHHRLLPGHRRFHERGPTTVVGRVHVARSGLQLRAQQPQFAPAGS